MLANPFGFREIDFSHLNITADELEEPSRVRPSGSYLIAGLILSVSLHGLLLLWQKNPSVLSPPKILSPKIHLTLNPVLENQQKVDSAPLQHENSPDTNTISSGVAVPEEKTTVNIIESAIDHALIEQRPRIITTLSRDELLELHTQSNPNPNPKPAPKSNASIGDNVFHPALRERLISEESKPVLQRIDSAPKTHTDPSGATIVDLGGGKCLRSSVVSKAGETQNWYMTSCAENLNLSE